MRLPAGASMSAATPLRARVALAEFRERVAMLPEPGHRKCACCSLLEPMKGSAKVCSRCKDRAVTRPKRRLERAETIWALRDTIGALRGRIERLEALMVQLLRTGVKAG